MLNVWNAPFLNEPQNSMLSQRELIATKDFVFESSEKSFLMFCGILAIQPSAI